MLSICIEKSLFLMESQMEWAFPMGIFRKIWNTFRDISLHSFLADIWKITVPFAFSHFRGK